MEDVVAAGYWEKVPIGQGNPDDEVRDWLQNVPAMHGLHTAEPGAGLNEPTGQSSQESAVVAPGWIEEVPAGHASQDAARSLGL